MVSAKHKRKFTAAVALAAVCIFTGTILYAKSRLENAVLTSTELSDQKMIVLDAGHGGMDGGCSSADGKTEKGINLNILLSVRDMARLFGYNVEATRIKDISIHDKGVEGLRNQKISDMENRLALFNKYPDCVCVSIHQNTFTDPKYSGAQMFYSKDNAEGEKLAGVMQKQFVSLLQPDNTRETKPVGDELYLLNNTKNPAVMIECGFLSNPEEAQKLENEDYQRQVAFTVLTGISEYRLMQK